MEGSLQNNIVQIASRWDSFTIPQLCEEFRQQRPMDEAACHVVANTVSRMVKSGKLHRLGRGVYTARTKNKWQVVLTEQEHRIANRLSEQYPLMTVCVYNGESFAPLQHHLAYNQATYVEVDRDCVETVFHLLQDDGYEVYKTPDEQTVSDYIDLRKKVVIVKPLVTQSPLLKQDGCKVPALEKLLVDIRKDKDFYYMQGAETSYISEVAHTLYAVNEQKLKRYADRRKVVL